MDINVVSGDITQRKVAAIIVNLFQGMEKPIGVTGAVDRLLGGAISGLIEDGETKGKEGEMTLIHTLGKMNPSRVLIAGLGKQTDFNQDTIRAVMGKACRTLREIGVRDIATIAHGVGVGDLDSKTSAKAIAEGALLGLYRFDKYKSQQKNETTDIDEITVVESNIAELDALEKGITEGSVVAKASNLCRDMSNEPANHMTPGRMAEIALAVARETNLDIEVMDQKKMAELGMGALLGVAQGSVESPKLIILRHEGDPDNPSNKLCLLGKGITFDTGGISIKPAANMGAMKGDMAGGAAVIATMKAISLLKAKINVTGIVPATENMPSGSAQRPGDIVRAMNGKTIEIDNTDAEGRLVLADAIAYARSLDLAPLVDVATLTGAIVTSLGTVCTGAFGNDQKLLQQVIDAGNEVGDKTWPMPNFKEYKKQFQSDVADIKNTGGRAAGSITGAQFIGEFAEGAPWVHLDIAGTSRSDSTKDYTPKGATGVPVRTLIKLALNLAKT